MDKQLKIAIMVGIILVALSVSYYFVVVLPSENKAVREQQRQTETETEKQRTEGQMEAQRINKEEQRELALKNCLDNALATFKYRYYLKCRAEGQPDNCDLRSEYLTDLEKSYEQDKDQCIRRYQVAK